MFRGGGGGNFFMEDYAMSDDLHRKGGLCEEEESVGDGGAVADTLGPMLMQVEEEKEIAPTEASDASLGLIAFPTNTVPAVDYSMNGTTFHFMRSEIPRGFKSVPPHVMSAYSEALKDETAKIKAVTCMQPCLPIIVHASPVVSIFSNTFVVPANQKVPIQPPVESFRYLSYTRSCVELHQLKDMCIHGVIPYHPSVTADHIKFNLSCYVRQVKLLNANQDRVLDAYYASGRYEADTTLAEFVSMMEDYCMRYIHTLEWFLFTCLIEPHGFKQIAAVLTPIPTVPPSLTDCLPHIQDEVVADAANFFSYKKEHQGIPFSGWFKDKREVGGFDPAFVYKGYIAFSTMKEYARAMMDK